MLGSVWPTKIDFPQHCGKSGCKRESEGSRGRSPKLNLRQMPNVHLHSMFFASDSRATRRLIKAQERRGNIFFGRFIVPTGLKKLVASSSITTRSMIADVPMRVSWKDASVALLVTIAGTTGHMEMSNLPQQVPARPQVHEVRMTVGISGAGLGNRRRNRSRDRTSAYDRNSDTQSKASEAFWRNAGPLARYARAKKTLATWKRSWQQCSNMWRKRGPR